ncbi:MAG TPA: hypothetical protein VIH06_06900 [Ilumatobacteraceae bacterium]
MTDPPTLLLPVLLFWFGVDELDAQLHTAASIGRTKIRAARRFMTDLCPSMEGPRQAAP